jgi:transposase
MAKAYSDDLRRKLLEAHQLGEGSLEQLAGRFRVSVSWAKKVSAAFRRTGRMERPPAGPRGPRSKLTPEIQRELRGWIELQPDLTLVELQQRLVARRGLYSSLSRLWEVLGVLGLRLKKSHSTPPSKTPKKAGAVARSGASRPARSPRKD